MFFFPKESNNQFWWVTVFPMKSEQFLFGRETKTHILPTKINENKVRSGQFSGDDYSFRTLTIQQQQIIQSGEALFQQASSFHPTLES